MALRETYLDGMDGAHFDVLIVGGGINGAVSAAVLAARGAKVALVERGDFAGFTSQESSNLVWGGFKYLENYELLLVRKLCMSRNRLIKAYPSNVTEIGFLAALDHSSPFPPWLAAVGSTAYWAMGNFKTKRPEFLSPEEIEEREPVIDTSEVRGGIEYRDAYLKDNDARFVFRFIRGALDMGASCVNYVELCGAERIDGTWHANLTDLEGGRHLSCTAEVVINAAGPFVDDINGPWGLRTEHRVVYSKGIHLVVPRVTEAERVLAFFDDTQRLFYVIPMGNRSVIGTTDTRVDSPESFVTDEDRELATRHLKNDYPVFEKAHDFLDQTLQRAFHSEDDRKSALAEFKDRCSRRYHNFYPPVAKGEPVPPLGSTPPPKPSSSTIQTATVVGDLNDRHRDFFWPWLLLLMAISFRPRYFTLRESTGAKSFFSKGLASA